MIDLITRLLRRVSVTTSEQLLKKNFPGDVNIEAIYSKNPHIYKKLHFFPVVLKIVAGRILVLSIEKNMRIIMSK